SGRRRHSSFSRDWSSDVCSSDLVLRGSASLVLAGVFLLSGRDALTATLLLGGTYLLFRSVVTLVLAVFSHDRTRRAPRYAGGARSDARRAATVDAARARAHGRVD